MEQLCNICQRPRSWRYQSRYPIISGRLPIPSTCSRCKRKQIQKLSFPNLETKVESVPTSQPSLLPPPIIYEVHHYYHSCDCNKKNVPNQEPVLYTELSSESSSLLYQQYNEQLPPQVFFNTKPTTISRH
jgi:hypothetical protein